MPTQTKERPIMFTSDMIRAILNNTKSQTRRVVKPQPELIPDNIPHTDGQDWWWSSREFRSMVRLPDVIGCMPSQCSYGQPGDRLWVRETHFIGGIPGQEWVTYKADADRHVVWRPSIFMPRWASRILLEITDVRVERVQEISWEDVLREGIGHNLAIEHPKWMVIDGFRILWNSLNAKRGYGWEKNPWVWVISFKVSRP